MKNFLIFKARQLRKVNAQRQALSESSFFDVPVLTKGDVNYIPAAKMDGEPASCYTCPFYNASRTCQLIGKGVAVRKLTYPAEATSFSKPIEYWPCCSAWQKGRPNFGEEKYIGSGSSPDDIGLIWINAARPGQEYGGANCGGCNGGDDCDHYITEGDDKRVEPTAFCRVLQQDVECGAVCSAWRDDDILQWQKAQDLLKELGKR